MIAAGCDVGSLTSKAVIMKDGRILETAIIRSGARPWESAERVMNQALGKLGLALKNVDFCVGTGYGRNSIPFVDQAVSEIACHGRGAHWMLPTARTVIDIGGQDCKALKIDAGGKVTKFITNDKCASGTGRFLEVMAELIGIGLEGLGGTSRLSRTPVTLASACTVWAQADVVQHLNNRVPVDDIGAGINNAMASRMAVLVNNIRPERDVCMTGGVSKNEGVVQELERLLNLRIKRIRRSDPQLAGALGAALFAQEAVKEGIA